MRLFQDRLVIRVGMNRGHQAADDVEFFIQHFDHRSEAVCGAGGIGNDIVRFRIVGVFIDAHYDGRIIIFARRSDDDLLHSAFDVLAGTFFIFQLAGGFDDDLDAVLAPVQMFRIAVREDMDSLAINDEIIAIDLDVLAKSAMDSIIFQKILCSFHAARVIDSDHFQIISIQKSAEYQSANSAKTIDTDLCHLIYPPVTEPAFEAALLRRRAEKPLHRQPKTCGLDGISSFEPPAL